MVIEEAKEISFEKFDPNDKYDNILVNLLYY